MLKKLLSFRRAGNLFCKCAQHRCPYADNFIRRNGRHEFALKHLIGFVLQCEQLLLNFSFCGHIWIEYCINAVSTTATRNEEIRIPEISAVDFFTQGVAAQSRRLRRTAGTDIIVTYRFNFVCLWYEIRFDKIMTWGCKHDYDSNQYDLWADYKFLWRNIPVSAGGQRPWLQRTFSLGAIWMDDGTSVSGAWQTWCSRAI